MNRLQFSLENEHRLQRKKKSEKSHTKEKSSRKSTKKIGRTLGRKEGSKQEEGTEVPLSLWKWEKLLEDLPLPQGITEECVTSPGLPPPSQRQQQPRVLFKEESTGPTKEEAYVQEKESSTRVKTTTRQ